MSIGIFPGWPLPLVAAPLRLRPDRCRWALIEPLPPPPAFAGRPEKHPRRQVVNAILYVVRTGYTWRLLPHEFPPWQAVFWYFRRWRVDGTLDRLHDALRDRVRDGIGSAGEQGQHGAGQPAAGQLTVGVVAGQQQRAQPIDGSPPCVDGGS